MSVLFHYAAVVGQRVYSWMMHFSFSSLQNTFQYHQCCYMSIKMKLIAEYQCNTLMFNDTSICWFQQQDFIIIRLWRVTNSHESKLFSLGSSVADTFQIPKKINWSLALGVLCSDTRCLVGAFSAPLYGDSI